VKEEDVPMKKLVLFLSLLLLPNGVLAERSIIVSFSNATLTVSEDGQSVMQTPVVLPRGNFYPVPVSGTVTSAVMGPRWTPTPRMIATGKYRNSYGPYEAGNAMGHCKVSISFDITHRILRYVRIHGNAQPEDLGRNLSSGCIRTPDALCEMLTSLARPGDRVHFVP